MNVKSEEHPHRFWLRFAPAVLAGTFALLWVVAHHLGWRPAALKGVLTVLAIAMTVVVALSYRTLVGLLAAFAAGALVLLVGFGGVGAVQHRVLARDGERTVAEVTAMAPGGGRGAPSWELRAADGRDIHGRISSSEYKVGTRVDVTFDPAGRVYPITGEPDPSGETAWTGGLAAALAVLVLSMPLWGRLGPGLERRKK